MKNQEVKQYVLGFVFRQPGEVLLIRKTKPEHMAGKLNGVGGKIEDGDSDPCAAMVREFEEEAGVKTAPLDWGSEGVFHGDGWFVHVFSMFGDVKAKTTTDEVVGWYYTDRVQLHNPMSNLSWLIDMILDENVSFFNVEHLGK